MRNILTLLLTLAASANASIVTFTDRTQFLAALGGATTFAEDFSSYSFGGTPSPVASGGNGLGYQFSAANGLWVGEIGGNLMMSTAANEVLVLSSLTGGIRAIGGNFFFDSGSGSIETTADGAITVSNGVDPDVVQTLAAPGAHSVFWGFISTSPLVSLSFGQTAGSLAYPGIDNLVVANVPQGRGAGEPVPEPDSVLIAATGLAALVLLRQRA